MCGIAGQVRADGRRIEPELLRRVVPHRIITFGHQGTAISRLKLRGRAYRGKVRRNPKR